MPLSSMTGYARSSSVLDGLHWQWEVKSVNGKGLDVRCRVPPGFETLDLPVREIAQRNLKRGNILAWEQSFSDRLRGEPLVLETRMEAQSILYRTLFLFAGTFVVVAILFVVVIWWIMRRGAPGTSA